MPYRTAFKDPDRWFEAEIGVEYDLSVAAAHRATFGALGPCVHFVPAPSQPVMTGSGRLSAAVLRYPFLEKSGYRRAQLHELMAFHAAFPGLVNEEFFLAAFGSVASGSSASGDGWCRFPIVVAVNGLRWVSSEMFEHGKGFPYLANYYPRAAWSVLVVRPL